MNEVLRCPDCGAGYVGPGGLAMHRRFKHGAKRTGDGRRRTEPANETSVAPKPTTDNPQPAPVVAQPPPAVNHSLNPEPPRLGGLNPIPANPRRVRRIYADAGEVMALTERLLKEQAAGLGVLVERTRALRKVAIKAIHAQRKAEARVRAAEAAVKGASE